MVVVVVVVMPPVDCGAGTSAMRGSSWISTLRDMNRLETVELEYVVALAEDLSFTAAAARLGMAQPALSRAIGRIERRLGVRLFVRTSRTVALSEAGENFVAGARDLLSDLDGMVRLARSHDRDRPLVVALRPGSGSGLLARALETWRGTAVRVELDSDPIRAVRASLADFAVACTTDELDGLHVDDIGTQPTVVLVPRGHPLTRARRVTLARVGGTEGFQSRCPMLPLAEIVDRVALTGLVVLAAADTTPRLGPDVRAVAVADAPATTLCLVRRTGRTHPAAAGFARHLRGHEARQATA